MTYSSRPRDGYYPHHPVPPPYYRETGPSAATAATSPRPYPRRSSSARYHRAPDPDPDDRDAWPRHQDDDPYRSFDRSGRRARPAARSPPPSHRYGYDETRAAAGSRRDPIDPRESHHPRHERDFARDPRASRAPRDDSYNDEPRSHRRTKTAEEEPRPYRQPPPDKYSRGRDYPHANRDRYDGGAHVTGRARDISPITASRLRPDGDGRHGHGHGHSHTGHSHTPRFHDRDRSSGKTRATSPPSRGRQPHSAPGLAAKARARSSTMPAQAAKWWSNPLVQAGCRTALSAGAQAAINNRGVHGDWLGAKGAKVATAALGAALMDGFINTGKTGGGGGGDSRDDHARNQDRSRARSHGRSQDVEYDDDDRGRSHGRSHGKSSGTRSKSEGRNAMKDKILQSGMDYMLKRAANAR